VAVLARRQGTMASIHKMTIKGIRNFDPDRDASIEFGHPLTIIVGPNGAGKTVRTCLKLLR